MIKNALPLAFSAALGCGDSESHPSETTTARTTLNMPRTSAEERLRSHGLTVSLARQSLIDGAIASANGILGETATLRLTSGASTNTPFEVLVVGARGASLGPRSCPFVLPDEPVIVVPVDGLEGTFERLGYDEGLETDKQATLSIMLLHELGHIINSDSGSFASDTDGEVDLNEILDDDAHSKELRADRYAATEIGNAFREGGKRFEAVQPAIFALQHASFNIQAKRTLEMLPDRIRYRHDGQEHPSLEIRFYLLNYLWNPTPIGREVLETALRRRGASNSVLFKAE
jgi:hypothetical protein